MKFLRKWWPKKKRGKGKGKRKKSTLSPRMQLFKEELIRMLWRLTIAAAAGLVVGTFWFFATLPDIDDLNKFTKTPSILIKSEDGQIIGSYGDIYGDYIPFNELPNSLVDAVIATEDRNFYRHFGVDPLGLARAMFVNMRAGHVVQGGSTITQQVAKNVFLTPERSMLRKLREMLLAIKLERRFSKEDIMSIYLNRVYLGAGSYGADAAARRYFDKSARDLTLPESAIMAGLLKAPSRFAPTSNPALSRKRADQVLLNMQDAGFLTDKQTKRAQAELATTMNGRKRTPQSNLYFADWIIDQIPEYIGTIQDDIVVTTTLRPAWQVMADKAVADIMDKEGDKHDASQAALLAMTPDGAIRAMIGGRSYGESQYNRATQSQRQPGSAFKLFVYLAGLEAGLTPDTLVEDHPLTIDTGPAGKWQPKNYNGRYLGDITVREAVAESVNTVAVQVSEQAGLSHVIDVAQRLGITSHLEPLHSIALGAVEVSLLELTNAYAHLAAGGQITYPYGIISIDNRDGAPVYRRTFSSGGAALSTDVVGMMNDLLTGVVKFGTGRGANIGRPVAGKTGTTSDYKDAWFIGYTPDLVAGVWVGNDDNTPMKKVTGGMLPAMIWHNFMIAALANTPAHDIPTEGHVTPWAPEPQDQRPEKKRRENSDGLGANFWEKLFSGGKKPEKNYPGQ